MFVTHPVEHFQVPLERVPGGRSNAADSIDKPARHPHRGREGRGVSFKIDEVEPSSYLRNVYNKSEDL